MTDRTDDTRNPGDEPAVPSRRFGRRQLLAGGGAAAAAWATSSNWLPELAIAGADRLALPGDGPQPSHRVVLRRREDLLRLHVDCYNLKLVTTGPAPRLVRIGQGAAAYVVVRFPPQAVAEQAFFETDPDYPAPPNPNDPPNEPVAPLPAGARLGGESRLAFRVPDSVTEIPYTIEGLLGWGSWTPQLAPAALPANTRARPVPQLRAPLWRETALELPWWLILSPDVNGGWAHEPGAVTHDGVTELWHTRLGVRADGMVDEHDEDRRTVRAVWTRDPRFATWFNSGGATAAPLDGEDFPQPSGTGLPFRMPLSPRDRFDLVVSTSDFEHEISDTTYSPEPVAVNRLMLTGLGGWLDVSGAWRAEPAAAGSGTSLEAWRHIATGGRDHYVRIVRRGALFPFRHGVSLVKVTERKFETLNGRRFAVLRQRYFIVVRQRRMVYGDVNGAPNDGRAFPFTRLDVTTLVTPAFAPPADNTGLGQANAFVPTRLDGQPIEFHMVGIDWNGRPIDLATPAVFVDGTKLADPVTIAALREWYAQDAQEWVNTIDLDGAAVAVAQPREPGDTDVEVHALRWGSEPPEAPVVPGYFPTMTEASIRLASAEATAGGALPAQPVVVYHHSYVDDGLDAGPGDVFVQLKDVANPVHLDFGAQEAGDRAGGVITPNIAITALSRAKGPVGGNPDTVQQGNFDPAEFFPSSAQLLGDLTLQQVIVPQGPADFASDRVIRIVNRETPDALITEMVWRPALRAFPQPPAPGRLFIPDLDGTPATLDLTATFSAPKDGGPGTAIVHGDLRNFSVSLLTTEPFVEVRFDRLRFTTEAGKDPDVEPVVREVVFAGALRFVEQLKDYLAFDDGGFAIDVMPTQLQATFQLPIPSIPLGVFSLQNLAFVAGVTVPFTGQPVRFRFGFSTKEDPFMVAVMMFGGGGFFALAIGADGVEEFVASLEFGATACLNLGVASGSIAVTAGVLIAIGVETPDTPDGEAALTGFIKLKGEVDVLGIVTASLYMEAGFTYIPDTNKAVVYAVTTIEVEVLGFGGSYDIAYEKKFGGSGDPTFGDALTDADWATYAAAFAPQIGA
jgi:hypothetical protein